MSTENSEKIQLFSNRLQLLIEKSGKKNKEVAEYVGVSPSAVSAWLAGRNYAKREELKKLSALFGQSVEYILGETDVESAKLEAPNARFAPPEPEGRLVPVISWASAGAARAFEDLEGQIEERIWSSTKDPMACAIIIEGDSMEPEYHAGDRVVFNPHSLPRKGEDCLVKMENGTTYFKRYFETGKNGQIVQLVSRNPNYDPIEIEKEKIFYAYPAWEMIRRARR